MSRALADYRRKRDFGATPEPAGGRHGGGGARRFVVQKHAARRLHYDFRLELDGTLKSWAVPQGPGTAPGEKRLAVHVEDHPLDYASFEGEIPKGQYGAGTVEIWDEGTWAPVGDARRGYRKGHLQFSLEGRRLHGAWDLVRIRPREGEKGDPWLLIRRRHALRSPMPGRLRPQLATLVDAPPQGEDWLYEIKYDGYRMLARIREGEVRLFSRNGKDWTERFPAQAKALRRLRVTEAWLDGEMAAFRPDGRTSFQALQNALEAKVAPALRYALFDLLYLDGEDWRPRPLAERKARLKALLPKAGAVLLYSEHLEGGGQDAWRHACAHGLEGVIGKRRDAAYVEARTRDWVKLKCHRGQEMVIGGYTDPKGSRTGFGALLVGVREGGRLRYAGKVGTGFDEAKLASLTRELRRRERAASPFAASATLRADAPARGTHWVRADLVADIRFTEWTDDGRLRHPVFVALREDKPAVAVRREAAGPPAGVAISHPERVLYPEAGVTKLDLARYYERVAKWILPHLEDRPLSVVRCPRGPSHQCFFQRNAHRMLPHRGAFIVADTSKALLQLVQHGVIELHTWGSRARKPARPDRLTFDLDPDPALPWSRVVDGALLVRALLEELGLRSFLKTTGGKGLHLVVPVKPEHAWPEVKDFARRVAVHLAATLPQAFTATITKARRTGRIFVDYLRNQEGATAVCAYSVRAGARPTVSVPLAWEELTPGLDVASFDLHSVPGRLAAQRADPWKGYARAQALGRAMARLP